MRKRALLALGGLVAGTSTASAENLIERQARAIIVPWYSLFNVATRGDVNSIQEQVLASDYESCAGYLPGECWGRDTSIKAVRSFSNSIPKMKFDMTNVREYADAQSRQVIVTVSYGDKRSRGSSRAVPL